MPAALRSARDAGRAWRSRTERLLERADRHPALGVVLRSATDLTRYETRDRIFGLTGQAFLALVPLAIVLASAVSPGDGALLADDVIARLAPDPGTAETIRLLFSRPTPAATGASVASLVIVVLSLNSFARTLRRTVEAPWGLPRTGLRGQAKGLAAVLLLLLTQVVVAWVAVRVPGAVPLGRATATALVVAVATLAWWVMTWLLAGGRLPLRVLWPGAVVGGVAQAGVGWWTVTFVPTLVERDAARYGVIGVALALLAVILAHAAVAVAVGIVGARVARAAGWPEAPTGAVTRD